MHWTRSDIGLSSYMTLWYIIIKLTKRTDLQEFPLLFTKEKEVSLHWNVQTDTTAQCS